MACAVSAYTTQQGLATSTSDMLVSVGVALSGGLTCPDAAAAYYQTDTRAVTPQQEAAVNPNDPFAWFNLGTSNVALQDWPNAAAAYDHARQLGLPWRMTWYQFGWFDAYLRTGRYDDVLALADTTIKVTPNIEEMFYYKGMALQALGNFDAARSQFELALKYNSNFEPAKQALAQ